MSPTTPNPISHGSSIRGLEHLPHSASYEGRFGRMFRTLPPHEPADHDLRLLANTMIEPPDVEVEKSAQAPSNHKTLAAGYTYLGQFIDHDLTFDPTSRLQRQNDPDGLHNFRTPRFDLDSLYGSGPADSPFLYQHGESPPGRPASAQTRAKFLLGKDSEGKEDLPRNSVGRALIGDPRNDENLIVSQLHLAFLKYHNSVVDELAKRQVPATDLFEEARQVVRWHYQWLVIHDFLPRIVGPHVVADILRLAGTNFVVNVADVAQVITLPKVALKFFHWNEQPFIPVEFAVAAYRFGHSLVRNDYAINDLFGSENEVVLFANRTQQGSAPAEDLRGFRPRPAGMAIDWGRFFGDPQAEAVQMARTFDTQLVHALSSLPGTVGQQPPSLAERNLLRGKALGLPTGQDVARAMGIPEAYILGQKNTRYPFQIGTGYKLPSGEADPSVPLPTGHEAELLAIFADSTPLWYYVLKEAELIGQGQRLGPVGGRIVAEVFIGLLDGDRTSFLRVQPMWRPQAGEFGCREEGVFGVVDLIQHGRR